MFKPTENQRLAIDTRGSVLVTAAAGSGKTAVLVERVVKMICDEQNPVSVDRLLIVTFTNAAAAEMRGRIEKRLALELEKNPANRYLKRQMLLLPSAQICTIDTFCINLVRENFSVLSLSPDFKIVTDTELYPVYNAAMDEILDYYYSNDLSRLAALLDVLGCGGDDNRLKEAVLKVFDFTCSMPFPAHWLEGCKKMYEEAKNSAIELWIPAAGDCDEANDLQSLEFVAPHAILLLEITERFINRVNELLREQNTFTFHNTEQMALSLLCDVNGDTVTVSERAKELSEGFAEILVDEYQDTNDLQDTLFRVLSAGGKKLFAVGDVKQSIYGFRGANPENFVRQKDSYLPLDRAKENDGKKIALSANFRSRKEICGFVNYLFSLTMSREFGGVDYNSEEVLVPLGSFPQNEAKTTEVHLINTDDSEDGAAAAEAKHIAAYIKNILNEPPFLRDGDTLRKARFSDFAILMRYPGGHAATYVEELRKAGIPASFETGGFLASREIAVMLSLIRVIGNPTHDVPLISVMMSPIFGFTADEVTKIRLYDRKGTYYAALLAAEKNGDEKAVRLLDTIRRFRRMAVTMSVDRLLSRLYEETGITDLVLAMSDGERRKNNLLSLLQCAREFSENGGTLDGFVSYTEKVGESIKSSAATGGDTVTIMSFHGSKGLQFPICIIAGCFRRFNKSDSTASLVLDRALGMSFKALDVKNNTRVNNVARAAIAKSVAERNLSEELRVLYVALTRAEERLCVVLTGKNHQKKAANVAKLINDGKQSEIISGAGTYYDWFMYALLCYDDAKTLREQLGVSVDDENLQSPDECKISIYFGSPEVCPWAENEQNEQTAYDTKTLLERINYKYPYEHLSAVASKTSVSEIVHASGGENDFLARPAFLSRAGLTPAQRGTATHKFMQFADYDAAQTSLSDELDRLVSDEYITLAEAEAVDKKELAQFFSSDIFARMQRCELIREMRFLTEMPISAECDEKTVVQGVIDCVLCEENSVSVLDFKTDRVKSGEELTARYAKQLEIYAQACEKMFSKPVGDKLIYSFALGKVIKI